MLKCEMRQAYSLRLAPANPLRLRLSYGWISMKFYGSITAGVCTIWLRFEPDAAQSPDPGSGHCIQYYCKADSAKSNGRISKKFLCMNSL